MSVERVLKRSVKNEERGIALWPPGGKQPFIQKFGGKLLIVGHRPGDLEVKYNCPFVGQSGKNLLFLLSVATGRFPSSDSFNTFTSKGLRSLWLKTFSGRLAIVNLWHKNGRLSDFGAAQLRRLDNWPLMTEWNVAKLVLGRPAITRCLAVAGKKRDSNWEKYLLGQRTTKDLRTFYWYHPDSRNFRKFWALDESSERRAAFNELQKFIQLHVSVETTP